MPAQQRTTNRPHMGCCRGPSVMRADGLTGLAICGTILTRRTYAASRIRARELDIARRSDDNTRTGQKSQEAHTTENLQEDPKFAHRTQQPCQFGPRCQRPNLLYSRGRFCG